MHSPKSQEFSRRLKEGASFEDLVWEIEIIYLIRECFNLNDPAGVGDFGRPEGSPAEEYESEAAMLFDQLLIYHLSDRKLTLAELDQLTKDLMLKMFSDIPKNTMEFSMILYGELHKLEVNYQNRMMIQGKPLNLTVYEEYEKIP